jgi:hypothetical protein
MKSKMLSGAAALLALSFAAPAEAVTYIGARTVGTANAQLSITTDDTIGVLSTANILSWVLNLTSGADMATLVSGSGTDVAVEGSALTATATELSFDFDGDGAVAFRTQPGNLPAYCVDAATGITCLGNHSTEGVYFTGNYTYVSRSGIQVLATAAAPVPEPATWALMIAGFGAVGGALRYRRRQDSYRLA